MNSEEIWREVEKRVRARAESMPTEEDALRTLCEAFERLKELGWRETDYAPRDGSGFNAIDPRCRGIMLNCFHMPGVDRFCFWHPYADDLWPVRPILFKVISEEKP